MLPCVFMENIRIQPEYSYIHQENGIDTDVQDRLPQNMAAWHIEYLKLKEVGKKQKQKDHSEPPAPPLLFFLKRR